MTQLEKTEIKTRLDAYVARYDSQNKAANTLQGVSSATISQILNNNWEKIADEMWRTVASQIGGKQWQAVETRFYNLFTQLLSDAKEYSFVYAVTAEAGSGKTFTARQFTATNKNVFHLVCNEGWRLQGFLYDMLRVLGLEVKKCCYDNSSMLAEVVMKLKKLDTPLVIFDEADKLHDSIYQTLITLYNQTEDYCGIVLCATPYLDKRITRGVQLQRRGYNELFSRIGRKFVNIPSNSKVDIKAICLANGIDGDDQIAEVIADSECDLRRVKRAIHSIKNR